MFGGMLVSTVAGVFIVPVLYVVVMHTVARLGRKRAVDGPAATPLEGQAGA